MKKTVVELCRICAGPAEARGLCHAHYEAGRRWAHRMGLMPDRRRAPKRGEDELHAWAAEVDRDAYPLFLMALAFIFGKDAADHGFALAVVSVEPRKEIEP